MSDFLSPDTTLSLMNIADNDLAQQKAAQMKKAKYQTTNRVIELAGAGDDPIQEAAQNFEAVFIAEMMKPMFADISTEAPFGGGKGEEVFRGMLLQEYGKIIAQTGSIGMSDHIKSEMIRMQAQIDSGSHELIEEHEDNDGHGMEPLEVEFSDSKTKQTPEEGAAFNATNPIGAQDE